jgi:hypothetical protein
MASGKKDTAQMMFRTLEAIAEILRPINADDGEVSDGDVRCAFVWAQATLDEVKQELRDNSPNQGQ